MYNYDTEKNDEPDWDSIDQRADELHDRKVDELAHLPKDIWDQVRHLPLIQAKELGGQLLFIKKQTEYNRAVAKSIWGGKNEQNN
jgi:hypothetical protein